MGHQIADHRCEYLLLCTGSAYGKKEPHGLTLCPALFSCAAVALYTCNDLMIDIMSGIYQGAL